MIPDLNVRPARPDDAAALARLIAALADYERLPGPDAGAAGRVAADLAADPPRFRALLAERAGDAVGYAVWFPTYSTFLARPGLYLEDLFVLPEHRGLGAGRGLFLELARLAHREGFGRMEWSVLDWNAPSIAFYERLGARRNPGWLAYRLDASDLARLARGA